MEVKPSVVIQMRRIDIVHSRSFNCTPPHTHLMYPSMCLFKHVRDCIKLTVDPGYSTSLKRSCTLANMGAARAAVPPFHYLFHRIPPGKPVTLHMTGISVPLRVVSLGHLRNCTFSSKQPPPLSQGLILHSDVLDTHTELSLRSSCFWHRQT